MLLSFFGQSQLKFRDSDCTGCFQRPVCVEQVMKLVGLITRGTTLRVWTEHFLSYICFSVIWSCCMDELSDYTRSVPNTNFGKFVVAFQFGFSDFGFHWFCHWSLISVYGLLNITECTPGDSTEPQPQREQRIDYLYQKNTGKFNRRYIFFPVFQDRLLVLKEC